MQPLLSDSQLREQVIKIAQTARQKLPDSPTASDIERIFCLIVKEDVLPADKDGMYIEQEAKILINIRVTSLERRKFTLYHELAHHLVRQDDDLYSYLNDAYPQTSDFDRVIELICNIGAAEILLPREIVRNLIDQNGMSLGIIPELCEGRIASGPAALIQLVQNAPNQCYGVVAERNSRSEKGNLNQHTFSPITSVSNALYILYAIWSPSVRYPLARFTTIPSSHLLSQASNNLQITKGFDRIPFRSGKEWQVPCEAIIYRNKVYGLFHVTPCPDNKQPKLF